jgi:hypothetical protein
MLISKAQAGFPACALVFATLVIPTGEGRYPEIKVYYPLILRKRA